MSNGAPAVWRDSQVLLFHLCVVSARYRIGKHVSAPEEGLLTKGQQTFTEAAAPFLAEGEPEMTSEDNTVIHCLCGLFRGLIMCNSTAFQRLWEHLEPSGPQPLLLLPASVENQIMAGGHLSSRNDGNGFCKVKPENTDTAVTSLLSFICCLSNRLQ